MKKATLSNQTTSLLRPLWLGTNGGLNSEVLLYFKVWYENLGLYSQKIILSLDSD